MTHHIHDPYLKLRPPPATPFHELCHCPGHPAIKLMCALNYNPLHCLDCNLEIEPASLPLPVQLVESIAAWRSSYDAIDRLWLESGEYEAWAKAQLSDITSPINVGGMRLRAQLDVVRRCYLWYFQALWEFPPKGRYLVVEGYRPKTAYPPKSSVIRWKMCFRLKMP